MSFSEGRQPSARVPAEWGPVAVALLVVLLAAGLVRLALLAPVRAIDTDELEHLHVGWAISQGQVPYRDFFEHHTPLYHFGLAALCAATEPHEGGEATVACIRAARVLGLAAALALAAAVAALGRQLGGWRVAVVACAFALGSEVVVAKGLEVRPDALAVALVTVAAVVLDRTTASRRRPAQTLAAVAAGVAVGLALMLTQKVGFLLPGLLVGVASGWRRASLGWRTVATRGGAVALGAAIPVSATLLWLLAHRALARFVELALVESLSTGFRQSIRDTAWVLATADPFVIVFGLAGVGWALLGRRAQPQAASARTTACLAVSGLLGVVVMPVPYPQTLLLVVPFLAVSQALLVVDLVAGLAAGGRRRVRAATAGTALVLLAWALAVCGPPWHPPDWIAGSGGGALSVLGGAVAWGAGWLGLAALAVAGRRAVAVAVAALLLQPALFGVSAGLLEQRNEAQLDTLRWVATSTPADAKVLDGWTGLGVFRPHAWYYFMLPAQVRAMIPDAAVAGLARDLRAGVVVPDLVVMDEEVVSLGPAVTDWLRARYRLRRGPFLALATPRGAASQPSERSDPRQR